MAPGADPEKVFKDIDFITLGNVTAEPEIVINKTKLALKDVEKAYTETLATIFPAKTGKIASKPLITKLYKSKLPLTAPITVAKP